MAESTLQVPSDISFEKAIAFSNSLLERMETGELSPSQVEETVSNLVKTSNGARGFFVTYLASEKTLADRPSPEIVQALRKHPDAVAELLAKNVAMSAAMALTHRRNDNEEMALSSERVRDRTSHLIRSIDLPAVYSTCQELLHSTTTGEGNYQAFLERWGYDREQKQLMSQALQKVIPE